LGGNKEGKKTNSMIDTDRTAATTEHQQFANTANAGIAGSTQRASDMYGVQYGGYNDFASGKYDFNPAAMGIGGGGGGGGGGGDDPRFGDVESSYRNFMGGGGVDQGRFNQFQGNLLDIGGSGGWSPERMASMDQNIQGFKDIAKTGGVDDAAQARIRGGGVYDEFSKTGGLSEQDRGNIRSRATSTIPGFYSQMKADAARGATVQGGYGPGQAALASRLSRQAAGAGADASLNAELGITDQVNKGRQWGAQGMTSSEQGLQSLMSQNRLSGLTGASNTEAGMLNSIAQNRTSASSAGGGNEIGMQDLVQKGKMFGTSGLNDMAESAAARGAAGSAQADANARWAAGFNADNRLAGLHGMTSLYGTAPAETDMYMGYNLKDRDLTYGQQGTTYDARMANNPKRDWASTVGTLAGSFAGAATGLGAIGVGAKAAKAASDMNLKENIEPVTTDDVIDQFAQLPIYKWTYKGDHERHIGPMAQDMKKIFGVGDGHTIALVDVMGLLMLLGKAIAEAQDV